MAQIVPLDAIVPQPHVSIGKKLMDLSDAADARKLQQQTMAANKLKIDAATKEAQQNTAYDQSIALGGTDADQIKRAQAIGAGPYADALKRQKDNEQADALRQKTEHEAFGQFVDSTRKLLEPIYAPDTAESDRPLIYHHILNTIKSTGSKYAALLPADFDPTMLKQFEDAKLQNDMASKELDDKIKKSKEERDAIESAQKIANEKLTAQETQSRIDNAGKTPDLLEFDKTNYFKTYLRDKNIDPSTLNPETEAALKGDAFVAFKQAQLKSTNPDKYDQGFASFKNHPELTVKYGADQTGYDRYLKDQQIQVSAAGKVDTADSKSYQFHVGELDKRSKPIDDSAARFARLQDTIGQETAQADALIAPELMTVMAGGLGSGVRITNSEIERVQGGRPMIESLQSKFRSWLGTDQKTAINFGPDERKAMQDLMGIVGNKIKAKQDALSSAGDLISGSGTTDQQRRTALAALDKKMREIDGVTGSYGKFEVTDPNGKIHPFDTQAQADAFKTKAGIK